MTLATLVDHAKPFENLKVANNNIFYMIYSHKVKEKHTGHI